jgi:hypothetical protein
MPNPSLLRTRPTVSRFPITLTALIVAASLAADAHAQPDERTMSSETIHVTGVGEVQAVPDTATIQVGVVSEAASAGDALTANTKAVETLFETLDRFAIDKKDRQTTQFSVSPQYRRDPPRPSRSDINQGEREPQIVGYQVTNQVRVRVRKLDQLGELLDAVVQAGANRVQNIQFTIDQREALENQARRKAIEQATAKAKLYAEAAGVSLGRVLNIREQGSSPPPGPQPRMMMAEARSVPIASGQERIIEQVDVTFELRPASP